MAAKWIPPDAAQPQVIVRPCDLGFGLFAGRPFAAKEHILVFTGPELSFDAMAARGEAEANALQIDDCLYLDIGAPGVYANHSCRPNAGIPARTFSWLRCDRSRPGRRSATTTPPRCGRTTGPWTAAAAR